MLWRRSRWAKRWRMRRATRFSSTCPASFKFVRHTWAAIAMSVTVRVDGFQIFKEFVVFLSAFAYGAFARHIIASGRYR